MNTRTIYSVILRNSGIYSIYGHPENTKYYKTGDSEILDPTSQTPDPRFPKTKYRYTIANTNTEQVNTNTMENVKSGKFY